MDIVLSVFEFAYYSLRYGFLKPKNLQFALEFELLQELLTLIAAVKLF